MTNLNLNNILNDKNSKTLGEMVAAMQEPIDFEERAFNAVKADVFILDFINEFQHAGDRERARYEFKRAQNILRETLPHLFKK